MASTVNNDVNTDSSSTDIHSPSPAASSDQSQPTAPSDQGQPTAPSSLDTSSNDATSNSLSTNLSSPSPAAPSEQPQSTSPAPPDASLSDQERHALEAQRDEALCQTVKQGQVELKNWIHRQTQRPAERNGGEAFKRINNQLKQSTNLKRPRRKPDYKHFMSHPEYREQFMEHYRDATVDNPPSKSERIKKQCEVAEELFNIQPDDVKEKISLENSSLHSSRVAAFKKLVSGNGFSLDGADELTDAEKQLCRSNLLTFIQPLLDAIRAHTGLWLTLLAGAPPQDVQDPNSDFAVLAISSGTAQGLKFHEWKADEFRDNVMKSFLLFLHSTKGAPKKAADAGPSDQDVLNNPSLLTISEHPPSTKEAVSEPSASTGKAVSSPSTSKTISEPRTSTKRARKSGTSTEVRPRNAKNAKKRARRDEDDEEEYDGEETDEEEEEEEEYGDNEDDDDEEEEYGDNEDEEPEPQPRELRLHPNLEKKLHPESRLYLDSLSVKERRIVMAPLCRRQSAMEFQRENNIIRIKWNLLQITNGQTGSDMLLNGPRTPPVHNSSPPSSPTQSLSSPRNGSEQLSSPSTRISPPVASDPDQSSSANKIPSASPSDIPAAPNTQMSAPNSSAVFSVSADPSVPNTQMSPPSSSAVFSPSGDSTPDNSATTDSSSPSGDSTPDKVSATTDSSSPPVDDTLAKVPEAPDAESSTTALSPSAAVLPVDLNGCPKWLSDACNALLTEDSPQDPLWHKTLNDLVTLARYQSFDNPNGNGSTFPSTGRPKAFAWWFQNRKTVTRLPPDNIFEDVAKFASQWWAWYSIINPEWRERDAVGKIVVNGTGEGDWEEFDRAGQNGMLSLVVSLHWWYRRLDSPSSDWLSALRDVSWVISELVKTNRADASGRVTNYPGNMHKGYDSYGEALAGWRKHCRGFHQHPPGFIDGTLFVAPEIPETPPPTTPPPARINTILVPASSPIQTSSQISPSSLIPPVPTSVCHGWPGYDRVPGRVADPGRVGLSS
ncbi:hypothetical protein F5878DRAFT_674973 [Lentinula raphanica]|uniref:Uncharacterized protein n=1 Tax=Lentinula raphanica TaxID=153919 RepID=A0AA38UGI1_9AGAR|nr:hypothetical protein F5878DRAFT_674973 [Lentinula raphanica]